MSTQPLLAPDEVVGYLDTILEKAAQNPQKLQDEVHKFHTHLDDEEFRKKFSQWLRGEGQRKTKHSNSITDHIAQLIYLAPTFAGEVLDMCLTDLDKENKQPNLLEIKGLFMNDPMKAVYSSKTLGDVKNELGKKITPESDPNNPDVYEITQQECLIPNIIDIDIIQALAHTNNVEIFAKKSVQAILYAAWSPMMRNWAGIQTVLASVDLVVLLAWGATTTGGTPFDRLLWRSTHDSKDEDWLTNHNLTADAWKNGGFFEHVYAYNSPRHVPSCWNVLAASLLRQIIDAVYRSWWFMDKYRASGKLDDDGRVDAQVRRFRRFWSRSAYSEMMYNQEAFILVFKFGFLYLVSGKSGETEEVMTSCEQAMLCATFFFTLTSLLCPFRVVASKMSLSLAAIDTAVHDEEVVHFLALFAALLVFFVLAWVIVDRECTLGFGFMMGFRGLVVGDGDGLDFLGLQTDDETVATDEAHKFKAAFGLAGMIAFFCYLMQLLIAIFSNTYENAAKQANLHFLHVRAKKLRSCILGLHKFAHDGCAMKFLKCMGFHRLVYKHIFKFGCVIFVSGLFLQIFVVHKLPAQFFNPVFYSFETFGSVLWLTLGAVLLESSPFVSENQEIFPRWDTNIRGMHRLFIFCRADFDEGYFLGDESENESCLKKVLEKLQQLEEKIDKLQK